MRRKFIVILVLLCVAVIDGLAQQGSTDQLTRKTLPLRSNSKDLIVVRRNNAHQRMNLQERRVRMNKARMNSGMKQSQMRRSIRRDDNARIMQRHNRAIMEQQKMMMRRRMHR